MASRKSQETALETADHRHEVSVAERFTDDQLRSIASFEDAMKLVVAAYGDLQNITEFELGNGFRILPKDQKSRLVGVTFVILHFQFNEGDYGDGEFVSVALVTQHGDRLILNDGSTGIFEQLKDVAKTGRFGGIAVARGLRESEYDTCTECGKPRKQSETECTTCGDVSERRSKGSTFYLDVTE